MGFEALLINNQILILGAVLFILFKYQSELVGSGVIVHMEVHEQSNQAVRRKVVIRFSVA